MYVWTQDRVAPPRVQSVRARALRPLKARRWTASGHHVAQHGVDGVFLILIVAIARKADHANGAVGWGALPEGHHFWVVRGHHIGHNRITGLVRAGGGITITVATTVTITITITIAIVIAISITISTTIAITSSYATK